MLSVDPAVIDKFKAEYTFEADLIEMVNLNYYWTNADIDLFHAGNKYLSLPFEIQGNPTSPGLTVDLIEIRLANADNWFTSIFLNEDQLGQEVALYKYFDETAVAPYIRCFVENFSLQGNTFNLSLTTEIGLWKKKAMRYPSPSCAWVFKSPECGYNGTETWCDKTSGRCKALIRTPPDPDFPGNYANFGGRRYIGAMENKKIYWGEDPLPYDR